MKIQRSNQFGKLDAMQLQAFERQVGHRLPDDYREFLIAHNGGFPDPGAFYFSEQREPFNVLQEIYGLHDGPRGLRLDRAYEDYKDQIPSSLIPFASDPGGNAYCISISGDQRGKIYFWCHETGRLRPLANSFNEFLNGLGEEI